MASVAEKAAKAARKAMEDAQAPTQEAPSVKGWVDSKKAMDILGYSSAGALAKLRTNGKIEAKKVDGKWKHDISSLNAYTLATKGTRKGSTPTSKGSDKGTTTTDKGKATTPPRNTHNATGISKLRRIEALEAELAEIKGMLDRKGTRRHPLLAIVRKVQAFRSA